MGCALHRKVSTRGAYRGGERVYIGGGEEVCMCVGGSGERKLCIKKNRRDWERDGQRGERRVCPGDGVHQRSEGEGEGGVRNGGRTCVVH